jgi:methyl-accepting chemotaxis protein
MKVPSALHHHLIVRGTYGLAIVVALVAIGDALFQGGSAATVLAIGAAAIVFWQAHGSNKLTARVAELEAAYVDSETQRTALADHIADAPRGSADSAVASALLNPSIVAAIVGDFRQRVVEQDAPQDIRELAENVNTLLAISGGGLSAIAEAMKALAGGDATHRISGVFDCAFAEVQAHTNTALERLAEMIRRLQKQAAAVENAASKARSSSEGLSGRTEAQAASVEQTAATMEQLTAGIKLNADGATQAHDLANEAKERAAAGAAASKDALAAMGRIRAGSGKIGGFVAVIEGLASQTNLLSLNASIEAARAGESGRGFAVVAGEIRKLASDTRDAAARISETIAASSRDVEEGAGKVETGGALWADLDAAMGKLTQAVTQVADGSREQSLGASEIAAAVATLDSATQQNAALAEELNGVGRDLLQQSAALREAIASFRVDGAVDDGALSANANPANQIDAAIAAHRTWTLRLRAVLDHGRTTLSADQVRPDHLCPFGRWLNALPAESALARSQQFSEARRLHAVFHQKAGNVLDRLSSGDQQGARRLLREELIQTSETLMACLRAWRGEIALGRAA